MGFQENTDLQKLIGRQTFGQATSLLNASLKKDGYFRASLNGYRVNKSCRTVVQGAPYIRSYKVVCPLKIAQTITVAIRVNDVNIKYCYQLINNYPKYPCALKYGIRGADGSEKRIKINAFNIETSIQQLCIGDILYRQVISGDICLTNRYPSNREESAGAHVVEVRDVLILQFSLQVVAKMTADFDGDEMQLFFVSSPQNEVEISLLSSMTRQFINYQTGLNLIGSSLKLDVTSGIHLLKNYNNFQGKFFGLEDKKITSCQLLQKHIPKQLTDYDDGKIVIKKGELIEFDTSVCAVNSQFVTQICNHYGSCVALDMVDDMIGTIYKVNEICGSTLYPQIFAEQKNQKKYIQQKIKDCDEIVNLYYTGQIKTPIGIEPEQYFEQYIAMLQGRNLLVHMNDVIESITIKDQSSFYNATIKQYQDSYRRACVCLGQQFNEYGQRIKHPERTLICYPKFDLKIETQGFVTGNYINGLTQAQAFFEQVGARRQQYIKTNAIRTDGYVQRRIGKGMSNIVAGFNGLIFGDSQTIVSLQYGFGGYDSRYNSSVKFDFHTLSEAELKEKFGKHPRYEEIVIICNEIRSSEQELRDSDCKIRKFTKLCVPFIFIEKDVSEKQLDELWSCRITGKMSPHLVKIIHNQVYQFYIYALFYLEINPKSKHDIVTLYLQSILSTGDPIGIKSSFAFTQPYSQSTLNAIHVTAKGQLQTIIQQENTGSAKFMELAVGTAGPITFQTQLIGKGLTDEALVDQFVSEIQTIDFLNLKPLINIYYKHHLSLDIIIQYKLLSYFNINLQSMLSQLKTNFNINKIELLDEKDTLTLQCSFDQQIEIQQIQTIKIELQTNFKIGSQFAYNVSYFIQDSGNIIIKGNLLEETFQDLMTIPGIDQQKTYCSSPKEYKSIFGIQQCHTVLYNQILSNNATDSVTKALQGSHAKILSDVLTQTGDYTYFTRHNYRKQPQRDLLQLLVYEESQAFLQLELENPRIHSTNTQLNSHIFGTRAKSGTTFFETSFSNKILDE